MFFLTVALGACASYVTPGGPANFRALGISDIDADAATSPELREILARKPAAAFPAALAVARLQAGGYTSQSTRGYGTGPFSLVSFRDVEREIDIDRLQKLPMLAGIAPLNRLVAPASIASVDAIRAAAANVNADIVLIYTFDTRFRIDQTIPYIGTFTLGLFPNERAQVESTVSSAFIDVRSGYIYGLSEVSHTDSRLANAWTSKDAVDQARRDTEADAFAKLVTELERTWTGIAARFGPKSPDTSPAAPPSITFTTDATASDAQGSERNP